MSGGTATALTFGLKNGTTIQSRVRLCTVSRKMVVDARGTYERHRLEAQGPRHVMNHRDATLREIEISWALVDASPADELDKQAVHKLCTKWTVYVDDFGVCLSSIAASGLGELW